MRFEFTPTETGLRVHDQTENVVLDVETDGAGDVAPASTDGFRVPLDAAVRFTADSLGFAGKPLVHVRSAGTLVGQLTTPDTATFPDGTYEIETDVGFKLYLSFETPGFAVTRRPDEARIEFDAATTVTLGVRSFHERPAGVVTTSRDPRDVMRAVSTFGSALKTHSPERSYPTLRGHPPEIAVRGSTEIPADIAPPDTGVRVEVPPEYGAIFTVAPLAYYLGATVEPGLDPRLVAGDAVHEFDPDDLARDVLRVLRHCFLLDCVVRLEGLYPLDLYEHDVVTDRVDLDPATLYAASLADRTAAYLDVPLAPLADVFRWPRVTDVDPVPLNAEALPYVAYRLSAVRSPAQGDRTHPGPSPSAAETDAGSFLAGDDADGVDVVDPDSFPARHHAWVGDGVPRSGTKPTLGSYLRAVDADPHEDAIDVQVVHLDAAPDAAEPVNSPYGRFSPHDVTVTTHDRPTMRDLHDLLADDHDFVHFVGHTTSDGIPAADGTLDVRTLPQTGVSAFYLSGQHAHRHALSLVRVGALAGIATLDDTTPGQSRRDGRTLAGLLDAGFSLAAAASALDDTAATDYTVLGDGDYCVCTRDVYPATLYTSADRRTDDGVSVTIDVHEPGAAFTGSVGVPDGIPDDRHRLTGTYDVHLHRDDLPALLDGDSPIVVDDDLHWTADLTADAFWRLLD